MRVNQAIFPMSVFGNTNNTANALYGFLAGSSVSHPPELIDDHWRTTTNPPLSTKITAHQGMVFWAKDGETLSRGFQAVAKKAYPREEWDLTGGIFDITACGLTWDLGSEMMQSKALVAIKTVAHNIGQVFNPATMYRAEIQEVETSFGPGKMKVEVSKRSRDIQSVMKNMDMADSSNQLVQRGCAILVVQTDKMKRGVENGKSFRFSDQYGYWGKEFRQIGSTLSIATLGSLVRGLL